MRSKILDEILDEYNKNPWWYKLRTELRLKIWVYRCMLRKYFDKEYILYMEQKYGKGWRKIHGA